MATSDVPSSQLTPPDENSTPDDIKAWVEEQLDLLADTPILGRFVPLGPSERRRGGTSPHPHFACFCSALVQSRIQSASHWQPHLNLGAQRVTKTHTLEIDYCSLQAG